jgi:hypothetical protein
MNCRVSWPLVTEAVPVAASEALCPDVEGPKFAQPFPVPAGGLLHGQLETPFCPGRQKSVPGDCAQAEAPKRPAPRANAILKLFIVHLPLQSSAKRSHEARQDVRGLRVGTIPDDFKSEFGESTQ